MLKQKFRRKLDRETYHFERTLNSFKKLAVSCEFDEQIKYFYIIERENEEVHFSGTSGLVKGLKDHLNLKDY